MTRDQILTHALEQLPAPTVLLAPTQVTYRLDGADKGRIDELAMIKEAYGKAVGITTQERATAEWDMKAVIDIDKPVSRGDVMLMVFRVRNPSAAAGADARTQLVIERVTEPHDRLAAYPVNITGNWVLHYIPFETRFDFAEGEWNVAFFAGYAPQAFELTDVRLLHFGNQVRLKELPRIRRTYAGIARDAAWRAEAAARIDRIRKADLSVTVVDCAGNPLPGAEVDIAMTRHAFLFGSAVILQWLGDLGNPDHNIYRQHIAQLFNHVVNENDLKWPQWSGVRGSDWSQERSLTALRWLKEHDFHTKGHCIIWPSWWGTIPALREAADDPDAMRTIIAERIRDLVTRAGPFIDEWDVINEPFTNNDVMQVLGNEAMIDWFKQTREHTADARLYLNDYDILASGGDTDTAHQQHFEESLRYLIDGEAPIGGIGMQSHFGENVTPPATLWKILDRFAAFNLPIQITEFDLNTEDEQLQANYTRDFMTAVFAHESVNGFVMWGFWEGRHWRPSGAMFRNDWSIKPNGEAYKQLVFDDWWTREKIRADANGLARVRGFLGTYRITVTHNRRAATQTVQLKRPGTAVTIGVDDQGTCGTHSAGGQREHDVASMTAFSDLRATKRKENCEYRSLYPPSCKPLPQPSPWATAASRSINRGISSDASAERLNREN